MMIDFFIGLYVYSLMFLPFFFFFILAISLLIISVGMTIEFVEERLGFDRCLLIWFVFSNAIKNVNESIIFVFLIFL